MSSSAIKLDYLPELPRDLSIGIGCIGSGFIMSDCQLVAYRAAGIQPLAIASRRPEKAAQVAARPEFHGKRIVTIMCSLGERYLSTPLFGGLTG